MKSEIEEAVLQTADEWLLAQEALVAAKQGSEETEAEQEAVDIAGSRLVIAVTRWRSSRSLPTPKAFDLQLRRNHAASR